MKLIIIIFVLIFVSAELTVSEVQNVSPKRTFKSLIFVSTGMAFSSGSTDFFSVYNDEFSGYKRDFKQTPLIGFGTKFRFGNYRAGIQAHVLNSRLQDFYEDYVDEGELTGYRQHGQDIEFTDIPVIGTFEYMPYLGQFRTYVGGGLGFMMRNLEWTENIRSGIPLDRRTGGTHYNDIDVFPFFKIYSGLELGFDKKSEETFLGSLVIEASYNYSAGGADIFKNARRQFVPAKPRLKDRYNVFPGYIALTIAVTFNFNKVS
jgi:hypothetical protein